MVYVIQVCWQLVSRNKCSCSQAVSKHIWHIPLLCVQWKTPDDGQRNCPKHVEFHSKNKFEKLAHLVGFIIRNESFCFFPRFPFYPSPTWLIDNHIRSILKKTVCHAMDDIYKTLSQLKIPTCKIWEFYASRNIKWGRTYSQHGNMGQQKINT